MRYLSTSLLVSCRTTDTGTDRRMMRLGAISLTDGPYSRDAYIGQALWSPDEAFALTQCTSGQRFGTIEMSPPFATLSSGGDCFNATADYIGPCWKASYGA